tara:strand:- start:1279 stop:1530 length:252 start_codon:yes stop_codon:yes gene_type:complete
MTRFHWTKETWGYALRDSKNCARATVVRGKPPHDPGFYAQVIASGMPDSGPYKSRLDAGDWAAGMLVKLELVPKGSALAPLTF